LFVKIRDFAFQPADERYNGQGPFVPKPNQVGRMGMECGRYGARGFGYGGGWVGGRFSWVVSSCAGAATAATIFDQEKAYAAAKSMEIQTLRMVIRPEVRWTGF